MSDTDGKKPLGLGGAPRSGQVKQSFSHGRTKSVVVETKRKRVVVPTAGQSRGRLARARRPRHATELWRPVEAARRDLRCRDGASDDCPPRRQGA
jgi:translation initiation factor IF-2